MSERFHKSEFIPPEERNLHQFKGKTLKEVIEYLEGKETDEELSIRAEPVEQVEQAAIFDGFLSLLREKGVRVSTPEWMQFLTVIGKKANTKELKELVSTNELLNKVRLFAKTTLVKDKADESAFHEAFDEYFELAAKVYNQELENKTGKTENKQKKIREKLGITEVVKNLDLPNDPEHADDETVHGGTDWHKEAEGEPQIVHRGEEVSKQEIAERKKRVGRVDRRTRYEVRPDKASMREVIRNIRRIITDVSEIKGGTVDVKRTVGNFARRDFRFDYEKEREKQPEIVLFIDVGGPVDEWSPLVNEVAEAMTEGLTKLEVYLFHNNLYGYVWKPDPKNLLFSSYAKPDSLLDVKKIVKHRKKVIIYGDAEMSYSEFEGDGWPPSGNEERTKQFGMGGEECLSFIKKKADAVVWINPVFQKEWEERDDSGTIHAVKNVIPMHDLTVGGVEDAIKELMKK